MAQAGDRFTVAIGETHLNWGEYRNTSSREPIMGEAFIPIPKAEARRLYIFNSNQAGANTVYTCNSIDGFYSGTLLAQGGSRAGDIYAKNFSEKGNLKALGNWFRHVGAVAGGTVEVVFTSFNSLTIEYR